MESSPSVEVTAWKCSVKDSGLWTLGCECRIEKGRVVMLGKQNWLGVTAGICALAATALAAPPGDTVPAAAIAHGSESLHHVDGYSAKHWDLWANYCAEKRREHDPVRHYYPLVNLKHSLLHHHHGSCGECDQWGHRGCHDCQSAGDDHHDCGHDTHDAKGTHHSHLSGEADTVPQPPAPPVSVEPRPMQDDQPLRQGPAPPLGNPIELSPEHHPTIVPPVTDPMRIPKNPLPQRRTVLPPQDSPSSPFRNTSGPTTVSPTPKMQNRQIRNYIQID